MLWAWVRDRLLEELKTGEVPTIERMEGAAAYVWGWTVVCYLEREYGREALVRIFLDNNDPDVFPTIDRQAEVEYTKWKAFVSAPDFVDGM